MGTHPIFKSDFDCLTEMNLDQIVALLPTVKGAALTDLVRQALISPNIVHYSDLLSHEVISSFEHTEHKMLFNVVKLFCFGDCTDYLQSKDEVGYELNPAEINKLQLLSLISLASQYHELDYASVMEKLGVTSHTKLEDVFIAANAAGYITGKMDQERQRFYINTSVGRDVQLSELSELRQSTACWANRTRNILVETVNAQSAELARAEREKQEEQEILSEIKSVREAIRLEHDNQNRRPSSSYRESHSDKKFVRKEAIDMTGENEMKPKKYKLRGRKQ